jgi:hypothetical protein
MVVREAQSLSSGSSGSGSSLVFQQYNPSLVDTSVVMMQSSTDTTLLLGGDASLDHVVSHLVQSTVVSMQSSVDTTLAFGSDASLDHVVSHPFQRMVEEVVVSMQSSVDPTLLLENYKSNEVTFPMQSSVNPNLLLEGDAPFDHVLSISSPVPSEHESIPLSPSKIPPSLRMVSFDWNNLVEPCLLLHPSK